MQTIEKSQQPMIINRHYGEYEENNHLESMKRSSKSLSKYLESSERLYSPNKKFIEETIKSNNMNTLKTKQELSSWKQEKNKDSQEKGGNVLIDETKSRLRSPNLRENYLSPSNQNTNSNTGTSNNMGKVVSKLQTRIDNVEVKIASLTNIIKLLQKYSQTKDDQYEKQKQNMLYTKNTQLRVQQIDNIEFQNKMKEFNALAKQMRMGIEEMNEVKSSVESILALPRFNNQVVVNGSNAINANNMLIAQNKKQSQNNNNPKTNKKSESKSATSQGSYLDVQDLATAFEQMEQRLRQEINKKIEICLKQIKKISLTNEAQNINGIDQNLFQEQINAINFNLNKLENEFVRNKMLVQNQLEEINSKIPTYYTPSLDHMPRKYANEPDSIKIKAVRDRSAEKSTKRSRSRKKSEQRSVSRQNREKSKSNLKLNNNQSEKLIDKKRMKEEQLQEAIRRKKEIKQKLKNSHNIKNFS